MVATLWLLPGRDEEAPSPPGTSDERSTAPRAAQEKSPEPLRTADLASLIEVKWARQDRAELAWRSPHGPATRIVDLNEVLELEGPTTAIFRGGSQVADQGGKATFETASGDFVTLDWLPNDSVPPIDEPEMPPPFPPPPDDGPGGPPGSEPPPPRTFDPHAPPPPDLDPEAEEARRRGRG